MPELREPQAAFCIKNRTDFGSAWHLKHSSEKIEVEKMLGIYTGEQKYNFDRFYVYPVLEFLKDLHAGKII
jgi:hypothetical protein